MACAPRATRRSSRFPDAGQYPATASPRTRRRELVIHRLPRSRQEGCRRDGLLLRWQLAPVLRQRPPLQRRVATTKREDRRPVRINVNQTQAVRRAEHQKQRVRCDLPVDSGLICRSVSGEHNEAIVGWSMTRGVHDEEGAIEPETYLKGLVGVGMVHESPSPRRRERGDERVAGRNHRRNAARRSAPAPTPSAIAGTSIPCQCTPVAKLR